MSVNSTIYRDFVPELEALTEIVRAALIRWQRAVTQEERLIIESALISQFENVLSLTEGIEEVSSVQYLNLYDVAPERKIVSDKIMMNASKLKSVVKMYLDYFNRVQTDLLDIIGSAKRCKQKLATLQLWDRSQAKWLLVEPFYNFDNLDMKYTKIGMANIVTSGGYLTLPVAQEGEASIHKIKITSGSNGRIGSSEFGEIVTENRLPQHVIDGNPDTWFEYERLDSGPCVLNLKLFLHKQEIVNGLLVEAVNLGDSVNYSIADIIFIKDNGDSVPIGELVSPDLTKDYYTVKTLGAETYWQIAHMPIKVSSITIKLRQENSYSMGSLGLSGRAMKRDRYAIGIRKISLKKDKYSLEGGINSTVQSVPSGIYGGACIAHVHPRNTNLYDIDMNVSPDGGETWENDLLGLPLIEGETILLSGKAFNCVWSLSAARRDAAFSEATSFSDEEPRLEMQSMQETVSTSHSPAIFKVKGKPHDKKVFVMQPGLAYKSNNIRNRMPLNRFSMIGSDSRVVLDLPFSLIERGIRSSDLRIFVNGQEWSRVYTNDPALGSAPEALKYGSYFLSPRQDSVEFNAGVDMPPEITSPLFPVTFLLKEEKLFFEERSDGYYTKLNQLFDPDKENISIKRLPNGFVSTNITIPQDHTEITLGISYIKSISFGTSLITEVPAVLALDSSLATTQYYIDKINGILYLNKAVSTHVVANIEHFTPTYLDNNHYEIWIENSKPIGLVVSPSAMVAQDIEDTLVDDSGSFVAPAQRLDVETGEWGVRPDEFGGDLKAFTLTEDRIVKKSISLSSKIFGYQDYPPPTEEEYVDGNTEFLGLKSMNKEYVPFQDADSNGFVSFPLAAGRSFYPNLGIVFKNPDGTTSTHFNLTEPRYASSAALMNDVETYGYTEPSSIGLISPGGVNRAAWAIDSSGVITVFIGVDKTLSGEIVATYHYTDPTFDSRNRFSVNYRDGILYLSESLDTSSERSVSYKTVSYSISYQLAEEVNSYTYDPEIRNVSVRTENLEEVNNKVKIIWGKSPDDTTLEELKDYFSPIIYKVGVRFQ